MAGLGTAVRSQTNFEICLEDVYKRESKQAPARQLTFLKVTGDQASGEKPLLGREELL